MKSTSNDNCSKVIKTELAKLASKKKAKVLMGFFKAGKGEYGEGDEFLGVPVPEQRTIAKSFASKAKAHDVQELLDSKVHEHRLTGLLILVDLYEKASKAKNEFARKEIVDFYLSNTKNINNWDLVDLSAEKIVGEYLLTRPESERAMLSVLAKSNNLWERRIAILTTYNFIKNHKYSDTLSIAQILLNDEHDLIHKAVGWMLREVGKRDMKVEEEFLEKYAQKMPRTMLRYAIERFSEKKRKYFMKK